MGPFCTYILPLDSETHSHRGARIGAHLLKTKLWLPCHWYKELLPAPAEGLALSYPCSSVSIMSPIIPSTPLSPISCAPDPSQFPPLLKVCDHSDPTYSAPPAGTSSFLHLCHSGPCHCLGEVTLGLYFYKIRVEKGPLLFSLMMFGTLLRGIHGGSTVTQTAVW